LTFQRMKRQTMTGTPYYMSPEVIAGKPYDEMVDIWSTGILCIELAELAPPYYDLSPEQALDKIVKEGVKGLPAGRKYSADFIDFVNSRCLQYDPTRRTPAAQLLQHPFIKKSCSRQEFASTMASWTDFEVDSGGGCNIL
jgi:serine/threonine protein kinase